MDAHRRERESNVNTGLVPLMGTILRRSPGKPRMTVDGTLTCNQKDRDISLVQASNESIEECYCTTHMRKNLKESISWDRRTGWSVGGKCWEKSINNIGKRGNERY